jgi:hypothetical protein
MGKFVLQLSSKVLGSPPELVYSPNVSGRSLKKSFIAMDIVARFPLPVAVNSIPPYEPNEVTVSPSAGNPAVTSLQIVPAETGNTKQRPKIRTLESRLYMRDQCCMSSIR